MSQAALFPERVVVAREVASLFGGTRTRLEDGARRVDPVSGVIDDAGIDIARLLSLVDAKGQPRRIAALCRRLPDVVVAPAQVETKPLSTLLSTWATALSTSSLAVPRRARDHARWPLVRRALDDAGVTVVDVRPRSAQRVFVVDDAEVVAADAAAGWKTLCDAGQGAMLAAGLCFDVAAFFVEAAGKDGEECFDKHFDDVSRAWFVQRIERALRQGFGQGSIKLSGAALVPPLPSSTSRVHGLPADAAPKLRELASVHRQVQEKQRGALARLVVELRLPQPRASWWQEKLEGFTVVAGDSIVVVGGASAGAGTVENDLVKALVARGAVVEAGGARALGVFSNVDDDADDDNDGGVFGAPVVVAPRAVGGVRATVDFDVGVGSSDVGGVGAGVVEEDVALVTSATGETFEPRDVDLPASWAALTVRVDDVVVDAASVDVRGLPGALRTRLDVPVRHGSLVVVSWDDEEAA